MQLYNSVHVQNAFWILYEKACLHSHAHRRSLSPCQSLDQSTTMQEWIDTHSQYLKSLDPNHLVGVGVEGFYGRSTPEMLPDNPAPNLGSLANGNNPAPYSAICEGQDFVANHAPEVSSPCPSSCITESLASCSIADQDCAVQCRLRTTPQQHTGNLLLQFRNRAVATSCAQPARSLRT